MSGKKIKTAALIVAAGRGTRTGSPLAKQYHKIGNAPVLYHTLCAFEKHDDIDAVITIIHPDDATHYDEAAKGMSKCLPPVNGGASRQESVRLGLEALAPLKPQIVLIHDAARPFVSRECISRVVAALRLHKGAIASLPVADTLKHVTSDVISGTCSRENLWRAQTPQGFHFPDILNAHKNALAQRENTFTDDAAVAEWAGIEVAVVQGAEENIKITTAEDLILAEKKMQGDTEFRTGSGYDVHRFTSGSRITLCGVDIAHSHGLEGHSDADVALHALTDALLGAVAAGDIGTHFPPSDQKWAGASSGQFARFAADLVAENGGLIQLVDITIICEKPKITPHRDTMRQKVSEILGISLDRVSVKATTTEGLGFTGREEGIAAHAVASIRVSI